MDSVVAIAMARDIAFISLVLVSSLLGLMLYRKLSGLFSSVERAIESIEEITSAMSESFVAPAKQRQGLWSLLRRVRRGS